jgi:hypothetical protein
MLAVIPEQIASQWKGGTMKTSRTRVAPLLAMAAVIAGVLIAGILTLRAQGQSETITHYACVNDSKGTLRMVSPGEACEKKEHQIEWNRVGPQGPAGPSGPAGACSCPITLEEFQALAARVAALEGDLEGDRDRDGHPAPQDCNDADATVFPGAPEACDEKDNDCDDVVDEDCPCAPGNTHSCYPGPAGSEGRGICRAGTQTCDDQGQWGACFGAVVPIAEVCDDGLDNDCDTQYDADDDDCSAP